MKKFAEINAKIGVLAVSLALSACGGGGGSSPGSSTPTGPVAAQRTVSGTAAKGLLKGAAVAVYEIDAQGNRASQAAVTAKTANDGTYTVNIPVTLLSFVIEVTSAPGAVMADEATGTDIPVPDSLKMRSVVALANNAENTYQAAVSPFTEMVARTAESEASGKLTSQAVANAKTAVRTLLGFDPEAVQPVNANSDTAASATDEQKNQSLMLAALSQMAKDNGLNCAQASAGDRIACVVDKVAGAVSVRNGTPALDASSQAQLGVALDKVATDKSVNHTGKGKVVGVPIVAPAPTPEPGTGSGSTPPVSGSPANGVEAAKALFGSLRTNLQAIDADNALTATAARIKNDLQNGLAPAGGDIGNTVALADSAIAYLQRFQSDPTLPASVVVQDYRVSPGAPDWYGQFTDPGFGTCTVQAAPLAISCSVVSAVYSRSYLSAERATSSTYSQRNFTLTPQAGDTSRLAYVATLDKRTVTEKWTQTASGYMNQTSGLVVTPVGSAAQGTLTHVASAGNMTELALKGSMPGRLDDTGAVIEDSEQWDVSASRVNQGDNLYQYNFGASLAAIRDGKTLGTLAIDPASYLRIDLANLAHGAAGHGSANELYLVVNGSTGTTSANGKLKLSGVQADKNGDALIPTRLTFEGTLQSQGATVFSGAASISRGDYGTFDSHAPESATNFVRDAVALTGLLSVPNRPRIGLSVGVTRVAVDAANVTAQYKDGTSVVNASVTARSGERHPFVSVASAAGVRFAFNDTTQSVKVTKDGATVATLDLAKGIIYYADGSYESLK